MKLVDNYIEENQENFQICGDKTNATEQPKVKEDIQREIKKQKPLR